MLLSLFLLWVDLAGAGGDLKVPEVDAKALHALVQALKAGDRPAVAKLMSYPVRRERPLQDIGNAEEFLKHYDEYFDESTIKRVVEESREPWSSWRGTGTKSGAVWFNEGNVSKLNVKTTKYEEALDSEKKKDNAGLHSSVKGYSDLLADCVTPKHHLRIQKHGESVKYFSWNKGRRVSSKPNLELSGGNVDAQGTARNVVVTFHNGPYEYEFNSPNVCGEICDPHLVVRRDQRVLATELCVKN